MSTDMNCAVYSLQDVINALLEHDSDDAWDFASDLTGLSTDRLAELVQDDAVSIFVLPGSFFYQLPQPFK